MGNSPSSSRQSSLSISRPTRTRSAQGSPKRHDNRGLLSAPSSASHRRSRSANAAIRRNVDPDVILNPPPPYSRTPPGYSYSDEPEQMKYTCDSQTSFSSSSTEGSKRKMRSSYLRTPMRQRTRDDMLETLRKYDTVIIVDDSSSMIGARWTEAAHALSALADLAGQFDADGIDIYFLNDTRVGENLTNHEAVKELFAQIRPRGVTPIGEKLEELLRAYLSKLEAAHESGSLKSVKPVNYLVITDGAPTDDPESVIVQAARRLDARHFPITQVGIQFVQIGKSASAARYLRELDDNLASQHNIRDIVDTTRYIGKDLSADALVKILLGGINRRVDNKGVEVFNEDLNAPILRFEGTY
ncbi:hypothetical protein VNI00_012787 [Paramarasmius palmivorus]|uniref:VWFA domain-containing protein n=1 Tax=Paramarasmius palmivorus TaxID=297713 RepID=A0AAW0C644_9AGAR